MLAAKDAIVEVERESPRDEWELEDWAEIDCERSFHDASGNGPARRHAVQTGFHGLNRLSSVRVERESPRDEWEWAEIDCERRFHQSLSQRAAHPPITPQFKMVFLTAAIGTGVFIVLCLVLSLIAGKDPPPLFEKVIMGFFDMAKIGFGAVVGLLGGKKLQAITAHESPVLK